MSQKSLEEATKCRLFLQMAEITVNLGIGLDRSIELARHLANEAMNAMAVPSATEDLRKREHG
jgi:hypothetical protein